MPRYSLELHWTDGRVTTGDYDSDEVVYEVEDRFKDKDSGITWRVERIEDAPQPFLAKLVCAPDPYEPGNF